MVSVGYSYNFRTREINKVGDSIPKRKRMENIRKCTLFCFKWKDNVFFMLKKKKHSIIVFPKMSKTSSIHTSNPNTIFTFVFLAPMTFSSIAWIPLFEWPPRRTSSYSTMKNLDIQFPRAVEKGIRSLNTLYVLHGIFGDLSQYKTKGSPRQYFS